MKWTSEELTFLVENYGKVPQIEIYKKLINHTKVGILLKVKRLATQVAMSKTRELVVLTWGRQDIRKMFLEVITDNGLPVMKRKWIKLPEMGNESLSKEVYPELWV